MRRRLDIYHACVAAIGSALLLVAPPACKAQNATASETHAHSQGGKDVYNGYFKDSQIKPRTLADWGGDWQSVYPLLLDGTLDPVMRHKAEHGDKTEADYHAYYATGYKTDVDRIVINGARVDFYKGEKRAQAEYASDGYEILTYKKGNRGVRFIFRKVSGDDAAPKFIQFSDHRIAPEKSDHYHLYWGDDRAALLKEVINWPTYYPAALTSKQIVKEMLRH